MEQLNVASKQEKVNAERKRIPMSVPVQRLEVPEIPGYHLHWFINSPERIQRALEGGYEFVEHRDMKINSVGLGGDSALSGNTDMGSRVSVISGQEIGKDGQPTRLVLMKIRQEWYEEDQKLINSQNERVAASIRGGQLGADKEVGGDAVHRYVDKSRTHIPDLFKPKH
jgi:hypothetical protein